MNDWDDLIDRLAEFSEKPTNVMLALGGLLLAFVAIIVYASLVPGWLFLLTVVLVGTPIWLRLWVRGKNIWKN